jgi:outer membrane protein assembly factor BamB
MRSGCVAVAIVGAVGGAIVGACGGSPSRGPEWQVDLGGECGAPEIAVGDPIVVPVYADKGGARLVAHRLSDGKRVWEGEPARFVAPAGDDTVVASDGRVLHAVDRATGRTRWRFEAPAGAQFLSPALHDAAREAIYAAEYRPLSGQIDSVGPSTLYALEASTGRQAWTLTLPTGVIREGLALDGDRLYVVRESGFTAVGLDPPRILWSRERDVPTSRAVALPAGALVIVPAQSLMALDAADGRTVWRIEGGVSAWAGARMGEIVYTGLPDRFVALRAADGAVVWERPLALPPTGRAAVTDEAIYVTAWDDRLHALDRATGEELWSRPLLVDRRVPATYAVGDTLVMCAKDRLVRARR